MAVIALNNRNCATLKCVAGQSKTAYHDTKCRGLTLEVRPNGRTWYVSYRTRQGTRRQLRLGNTQLLNYTAAREKALAALAEVAAGDDPAKPAVVPQITPTLCTFSQRYLEYVKNYKRSWKTDECLLRNHILPALGDKRLNEISRVDIIELHHGRRSAGAAPGSANRLLILLRYIFNLAIEWEIPGVTSNPTAKIPLFEENNQRERYLSAEEARRLYNAIEQSESAMLRYIVPMLILTGARKREVLNACWENFDLERRLWRIPLPKSGKARHVPLSSGVMQLLKQVPRLPDCPFVFPNPKTSQPFVSIFYAWNTARKRAGLDDVRIHDLRHSFASFLINNGRSLYEVQRILGHTQIRTTQRYSHLAAETLIAAADTAVEALGDAFSPRPASSATKRAR